MIVDGGCRVAALPAVNRAGNPSLSAISNDARPTLDAQPLCNSDTYSGLGFKSITKDMGKIDDNKKNPLKLRLGT